MRIVFFGTPEFAVPSLEALAASRHEVVLVVAQPDRPSGRGMRLQRPPVAERAESLEITVAQPARIRTDEFLGSIRQHQPELAVVVAYGKILPESLLAIPERGFINVHASLLPAWRGAAPIQRSIQNGDPVTGITIMRIDRELDHGPMLACERIEVGPDERAPSISARLARVGAELLVETVDRMADGAVKETEQPHDRATWAPKIEKEEGRVDWSHSARSIYNRFRAFDPWPGVFTSIDGETVKLTDLVPEESSGEPGTILEMSDAGVVIAAGEGSVRLISVQRAGRKAVRAIEAFRGLSVHPGKRLA